jgi:signal transduction histidine kinase
LTVESQPTARRILLVDDHERHRRGLRQMIELDPAFSVIGEGDNGRDAIRQVEQLQPDIVLMDMQMPVMDGVEATRAIKERFPDVKVLVLTAFADMSIVSAVVRAGASGYIIKGASADELLESLTAVSLGHGTLDKEITRAVMDDVADLYRKEQERADSLAELDRMKSEFVSVVSHELRTPLTSIRGGVSTLQNSWDDAGDDVKLEFLDTIARQCERLERMVDQMMTVSGIQRGGVGITRSAFSIDRVAEEALVSAGSLTNGRSVELDMGNVWASGDRDRIGQALAAVIENALRYTTGSVRIATYRVGSSPCVSVSDDGPGLSPANLERLFAKPFNQGDSSSTREVGGLGLSLYIARGVIEASGGRIDVDSAPEKGSTFTMTLAPARSA